MKQLSIMCKICNKPFKDYESNHRTFCSRKCFILHKKTQIMDKSPRWNGGRTTRSKKYVAIISHGHPSVLSGSNYVLEHRIVMENHIGRYLEKGEVVHHKNGDTHDNRIENLELFKSNGEHIKKCHPEMNKGKKFGPLPISTKLKIKEAMKKSLKIKGEKNSNAKLTNIEVLDIRKLSGKMSHKDIANKFNVSRPSVSLIINRKSWKHI